MAFSLEFETGNAAFDGDDGLLEVVRILRSLADRFENQFSGCKNAHAKILDINGNEVGVCFYKCDCED